MFVSFVFLFLPFKDANSRKQEAEWKEKAIKELEEWYARQDEQLQKTKANNRSVHGASSTGYFPRSNRSTPSGQLGSQLLTVLVKCLWAFSKKCLKYKGCKSLRSCEHNSTCLLAIPVIVSLALQPRVWLIGTACRYNTAKGKATSWIKSTCEYVTLKWKAAFMTVVTISLLWGWL